ncbi:hypothetical protein [Dyella agri]|uniref:RDD family protein n=1 Tax=Dyella agri TaxID=1926869 RepID=A0ABW8KC83_9GAMM
MTSLKRPFQLTSSQRWKNIGYGVAVDLGLFVLAMVFGNDLSEEVAGIVTLFVFGLLVGTTVRLSIRRGWTYYAERYQPGANFIFTKSLKIGALWRSLAIWFGGRFITILLLNQAESDVGLAILLLLSLCLVTAAALLAGLQFGWRSADSMLSSDVPTPASV